DTDARADADTTAAGAEACGTHAATADAGADHRHAGTTARCEDRREAARRREASGANPTACAGDDDVRLERQQRRHPRSSPLKTMLLAAGALLASAAPVAAQTPTQDQVIAEQLFEQGRTLVTANNWPAACPKFEESLKLDPTLGTKLNLATCYEHIGKIASAWSLYREAAEL